MALWWRRRWREPGGYRELTRVALPLVISSGGLSVQFFSERVVQTWYNQDEMAAALPAGITAFMLLFLFAGTAGYVSVFVAQYIGAKRPERLAASLGAGLAIAIIAFLVHMALYPLAGPFFRLMGHSPELVTIETEYFQALCWRAAPATANWAIAGYFSGQHRTLPVMTVNLIMIGVAVASFFPLIHGVGDFAGFGIVGGAWGEVIAQCSGLLLFLVLLARPSERRHLGWGLPGAALWHWPLFGRLLKYGLPRGIHHAAEIAGFALFVLLLGRLGTEKLGATSVAFDINSLVFMPMGGLASGIAALVGQRLGRNQPDLAARTVRRGLLAGYAWVAIMSVLYLGVPQLFLWPFALGNEHEHWPAMADQVVVLLRFVVAYALFDTTAFTLNSALGGAGDTRRPMIYMLILSATVLVVPTYLAITHFGAGLYTAWIFLTAYLAALATAYALRYRSGAWRKMRVIEAASPIPMPTPDVPIPLDTTSPPQR